MAEGTPGKRMGEEKKSGGGGGLFDVVPDRLEFHGVRVGVEQVELVTISSELESGIEVSLRAGNTDRYTVHPDKFFLGAGESVKVRISLRLPRLPPKKRVIAVGENGYRDYFYLKSIYFDQRFTSVMFLAKEEEGGGGGGAGGSSSSKGSSFSLKPGLQYSLPSFSSSSSSALQTGIRTRPLDSEREREGGGGEELYKQRILYEAKQAEMRSKIAQKNDIIKDKETIIATLQRALEEKEGFLLSAAPDREAEEEVKHSDMKKEEYAKGAAALSRAMATTAKHLAGVEEENNELRDQVQAIEEELIQSRGEVTMLHSLQDRILGNAPDARDLIEAALERERAVTEERSKQVLSLLSSKDAVIREERRRVEEANNTIESLQSVLKATKEALQESEQRCASNVEAKSSLREELHRAENESMHLRTLLETERKKVGRRDRDRVDTSILGDDLASLRTRLEEERERYDTRDKEANLYEASLLEAREEVKEKNRALSSQASAHASVLLQLRTEHANEVASLQIAGGDQRVGSDVGVKKNEDAIVVDEEAEVGGGGERKEMKDDKGLQGATNKYGQKGETAAVGGAPAASVARMNARMTALVAAEERARVAAEASEAKTLAAEKRAEHLEHLLAVAKEELETETKHATEWQRRCQDIEHKLTPCPPPPPPPTTTTRPPHPERRSRSTFEQASGEVLDDFVKLTEEELRAFRREMLDEREAHTRQLAAAGTKEKKLQRKIDNLEFKLRCHADDGIIRQKSLEQTIRSLSHRSDIHKQVAGLSEELTALRRSEARLLSTCKFNAERVGMLEEELDEVTAIVLQLGGSLPESTKGKGKHRSEKEKETEEHSMPPAPLHAESTARNTNLASSGLAYYAEMKVQEERVMEVERILAQREAEIQRGCLEQSLLKTQVDSCQTRLVESDKALAEMQALLSDRDRALYDARERARQAEIEMATRHRSEISTLSNRAASAARREQEATALWLDSEKDLKAARAEVGSMRSSLASSRASHERHNMDLQGDLRALRAEMTTKCREVEELASLVNEKSVQIQVLTDTLEALQTSSRMEIEQQVVTLAAQLAALKSQEQDKERKCHSAVQAVDAMRTALSHSQSELRECQELLADRDAMLAEARESSSHVEKESQEVRMEIRKYEDTLQANARNLDQLQERLRRKEVDLETSRQALLSQRQRHFEQITKERADAAEELRRSKIESASIGDIAVAQEHSPSLTLVKKLIREVQERSDVMLLTDETHDGQKKKDIATMKGSFLVDRLKATASTMSKELASLHSIATLQGCRCQSAESQARNLERELDAEVTTCFEYRSRLEFAEGLRERKDHVVTEHMDGWANLQSKRIKVLSESLEKANAGTLRLETKKMAAERQHAAALRQVDKLSRALRMSESTATELKDEVAAMKAELELHAKDSQLEAVESMVKDYFETEVIQALALAGGEEDKVAPLLRQIYALKVVEKSLLGKLSAAESRWKGTKQRASILEEEVRTLDVKLHSIANNDSNPDYAQEVKEGQKFEERSAELSAKLAVASQENHALQQTNWTLRQQVVEFELQNDSQASKIAASEEIISNLQAQHKSALNTLKEELKEENMNAVKSIQAELANEKVARVEVENLCEKSIAEKQMEVDETKSRHHVDMEAFAARRAKDIEEIYAETVPRGEHDALKEAMERSLKNQESLRAELDRMITLAAGLEEERDLTQEAIQGMEATLARLEVAEARTHVKNGGGVPLPRSKGSNTEGSSSSSPLVSLGRQLLSSKLEAADLHRKLRVAARTELELREVITRRDSRIAEMKVVAGKSGGGSKRKAEHINAEARSKYASSSSPADVVEPGVAALQMELKKKEAEITILESSLAEKKNANHRTGGKSREEEDRNAVLQDQLNYFVSLSETSDKKYRDLQAECDFAIGLIQGAYQSSSSSSSSGGGSNEDFDVVNCKLRDAVQRLIAKVVDQRTKQRKRKSSSDSSDTNANEKQQQQQDHQEPSKEADAKLVAALQKKVVELSRERINLLREKERMKEKMRAFRAMDAAKAKSGGGRLQSTGATSKQKMPMQEEVGESQPPPPLQQQQRKVKKEGSTGTRNDFTQTTTDPAAAMPAHHAELQEMVLTWKAKCATLEGELDGMRKRFAQHEVSMRAKLEEKRVTEREQSHIDVTHISALMDVLAMLAQNEEVEEVYRIPLDTRLALSQVSLMQADELGALLKRFEMSAQKREREAEATLNRVRSDMLELQNLLKSERSGRRSISEELEKALQRLQECADEEKTEQIALEAASIEMQKLRSRVIELEVEDNAKCEEVRDLKDQVELMRGEAMLVTISAQETRETFEKSLLAVEARVNNFQNTMLKALDAMHDGAGALTDKSFITSEGISETMSELEKSAEEVCENLLRASCAIRGAQTAVRSNARQAEEIKWAYSSQSSRMQLHAQEAVVAATRERDLRQLYQECVRRLMMSVLGKRLPRGPNDNSTNEGRGGGGGDRTSKEQVELQLQAFEKNVRLLQESATSLRKEKEGLASQLATSQERITALESSVEEKKVEEEEKEEVRAKQNVELRGRLQRLRAQDSFNSVHSSSSASTFASRRLPAPSTKKRKSMAGGGAAEHDSDYLRERLLAEIFLVYDAQFDAEREAREVCSKEKEAALGAQARLKERCKELAGQVRMGKDRNMQLSQKVSVLASEAAERKENKNRNIVASQNAAEMQSALSSSRRHLTAAQAEVSKQARALAAAAEREAEVNEKSSELQRRLRSTQSLLSRREEMYNELKSRLDAKAPKEAEERQGQTKTEATTTAAEDAQKMATLHSRLKEMAASLKRKEQIVFDLKGMQERTGAEAKAVQENLREQLAKTSTLVKRLKGELSRKEGLITSLGENIESIKAETGKATSEAAAAAKREVQAWRVAGADAAVMRHCAAVMLGALQELSFTSVRVTTAMQRLAVKQLSTTTLGVGGGSGGGLPTDSESITRIADIVGLEAQDVANVLKYRDTSDGTAEAMVKELCRELELALGGASANEADLGSFTFNEEPVHRLLEVVEEVANRAKSAVTTALKTKRDKA